MVSSPLDMLRYMAQRDLRPRVLHGTASAGQPLESERCVERELPLIDEDPEQRCRNALRRGPRSRARRHVDTGGITFVNDPSLVHDQQAESHLLRRFPLERPVRRGLQRCCVHGGGQWLLRNEIAIGPRRQGRIPASGDGMSSSGRPAMSSKVWFGARITQPNPVRKAARITGTPSSLPIATARRARSMT